MRRKKKKIILAIVLAVLAVCAGGIFAVLRCSNLIDELRGFNETLNIQLQGYENDRCSVCRVNTAIEAGSVITAEQIDYVDVPNEAAAEDCIRSTSLAVGRRSRINLSPGTCLTAGMLTGDEVRNDEREMTYSVVDIDWNIAPCDVVDFRILYPDGTDYTIVSHKRICGMTEDRSSVAVNMNEEEILLMDSAVVDAFEREGTVLYVSLYTEPELQKAAVVNYTPSLQTIELIENDPNIVSAASGYLSRQLRIKQEEEK